MVTPHLLKEETLSNRAIDAEIKRQHRHERALEQISSQSLHADTAEGNWRLVLANYPMKKQGTK